MKSVTLVQRAYRSEYKNKKCPTKATILSLSRKMCANERETRIDARIRLNILFTEDPSLSIRKASVDVGISYSLCRDRLLKDLRLKPYVQSAYQLLPLDYEKRVIFAQWWLGLAKSTYKRLIASDEAYFCLTESINKQNDRM